MAAGQAQRQVTPLLSMDDYALLYIGLLAGATAAVALLSYKYLQRRGVPPEEYYVLLLTATLGGADAWWPARTSPPSSWGSSCSACRCTR